MIYHIVLLFTTLISISIVFLWNAILPGQYHNQHPYFVIPFFAAFSVLTHFLLLKSMDNENKNAFTMRFMGISGVKLFLSLFIVIIYAFANKSQIISFAVLFLFMYFLFTGMETFFLYKATQKAKQQ